VQISLDTLQNLENWWGEACMRQGMISLKILFNQIRIATTVASSAT
jgi:hypothetical protein